MGVALGHMGGVQMESFEILNRKVLTAHTHVFPEVPHDVDDLKEDPQVFGIAAVLVIPIPEYFHAGEAGPTRDLEGLSLEFPEGLETYRP